MSPTLSSAGQGLDADAGRPRAALRRAEARRRAAIAWAHRARCRTLPAPSEAEVAAMVAAYRARGGLVTACPTAYAATVQNGTGQDLSRSAGR